MRLQRLASGFSNFTVSGLADGSEAADAGAAGSTPVLDDTTKAALQVVFAKDGSYAQEVRPSAHAGYGGGDDVATAHLPHLLDSRPGGMLGR